LNTFTLILMDFASVEQLRDPRLRGRPVGVIPYAGGGRTCIIACSREAKARGVKNIMMVDEARRICRDIVLVPQNRISIAGRTMP
jgi:DNA polymerase-4